MDVLVSACSGGDRVCLPTLSPEYLTPPPSPVHAGLLQGAPPVQLLVVSSEDLYGMGRGALALGGGGAGALTLSLSHLITQSR